MRKVFFIFLTTVLLGSTVSFASCTANEDNAASQYEQATFIPQPPDYNDAAMWVTADGDTDDTGANIFYVVSTWEEDWSQIVNGQIVKCHYADMAQCSHILVVSGYSGSEYAPYKDFLNVGDIHSCEPWLYSECLAENIKVRAKEWRKQHQPTI